MPLVRALSQSILSTTVRTASSISSFQSLSVWPFLFSLDLAKLPPPPRLAEDLWRHQKVPREWEGTATLPDLRACYSRWERVLVCLEIPGPQSTAMGESPRSHSGYLEWSFSSGGVSTSHKKGREYRKNHAVDRVGAEEGLVWGMQRYP